MADAFAEVSLFGLQAAWKHWIGPQRFHRKLAQFVRTGWLEEVRAVGGTERVMRLTSAGRLAALGGRDPEQCWRRAWDRRWRLVLFDVPESKKTLRAALRRQLHALGFGYLQNSAWITPDPIDALKRSLGDVAADVETLSFMEARPCMGETDAEIVLGAWDFQRINRGYDLYCDILKSRPSRTGSLALRRQWFETEWRAWCLAVRADPLLPEPLLPVSYRGRHAWQSRTEVLHRVTHH